MAETNKAFPDAAGVSVGQSTKIVDGQGESTVTVMITDKEGKTTLYALSSPVGDSPQLNRPLPAKNDRAKAGSRPGRVQGPQRGGFRDDMTESMLSRAEAICDLLSGVHDKETADAAAAPLEKQCLDLENMIEASRSRRLPQAYIARMIRQYNNAMESRIGKMEALITEMAAKDYYGSSAMKETAQKFCR